MSEVVDKEAAYKEITNTLQAQNGLSGNTLQIVHSNQLAIFKCLQIIAAVVCLPEKRK